MTAPRDFFSNTTYFITRRTSERRFFLKPSRYTKRVFYYCLAYTAQKHGIDIHCFVVMSNHYHLILTDPYGRLAVFMKELNSLLARALNRGLRRSENFFRPGSYHREILLTGQDVMNTAAYTLANPVTAGLVPSSHLWEGASSASMAFGDVYTAKRPGTFFRESMPTSVDLTLVRPDFLPELDDTQFLQGIRDQVRTREQDTKQTLQDAGKSFLGMKKVGKLSWNHIPSSRNTMTSQRPSFAHIHTPARLLLRQRRKAFLQAYQEMREQLKTSTNKLVFPKGTYGLVALGVVTALGS